MSHPISDLTSKSPLTPAESTTERPSGSSFQSLVESSGRQPSNSFSISSGQQGPLEVARGSLQNPGGPPSFQTLINQSQTMQDSLGQVSGQIKQIQQKNQNLTRSQKQLLKRHLLDHRESLTEAAKNIGLPPFGNNTKLSSSGTLQDFLSWIGHGQDMLNSVQNKLQDLSSSPDGLSAPQMLLVQAKLNQAQNEVQFSTMLLSKIVDTIKQLMQTQL
jgi:hypothetical protein